MIKPLPYLRKNDSNLKKVKRVRPEAKVGGPYVTTGFKKVHKIASNDVLLSEKNVYVVANVQIQLMYTLAS